MFGERLRDLRKSAGLTQAKFAEIFQIASGTIAMWETSKREPDYEMVARIADFFSVTTDYLLGRTDDHALQNEKSSLPYDDEAVELMREMHERDELKVLFKASKGATREDIEFVNEMLKRLKKEQERED